ncbi:MAG: hypothetical protein CL666_15635 [Balneola sp.]|nr:hypothetical protein [Balneola sp.]
MNKVYLILFLLSSLIIGGCLGQDEVPVYYNVNGEVVENGEPVFAAQIHFRNNLEPGGFRSEVIGDSVTIGFNTTVDGVYEASIFRLQADSVLSTFFEDTLKAGRQSILIPDSLLSNGIFGYEVSSELEYLGASLFLVNKPDSALIGTLPFTTTNYAGEFTLDVRQMAIGQEFNFTGGDSFEITDSLEIIVIKDSRVRAVERVKVEPNEENYFQISLD